MAKLRATAAAKAVVARDVVEVNVRVDNEDRQFAHARELSKQTKRKVAHDNKSQLDIITQQLQNLEETKIKLQGQATSLVVQKATQCMEKNVGIDQVSTKTNRGHVCA